MRTQIGLTLALSIAIAACSCERALESVEWRDRVFHEVRGLPDLPTAIQSHLQVGQPGLAGIADRSRPFNVTDVVDTSLPMRRLLAAARDGDTWLVAVEVGGMGYSVEVMLFSSLESTPKQRWVLLANPKSLREVVQQLSNKGVLPQG